MAWNHTSAIGVKAMTRGRGHGEHDRKPSAGRLALAPLAHERNGGFLVAEPERSEDETQRVDHRINRERLDR
jgi:hypothetical protein